MVLPKKVAAKAEKPEKPSKTAETKVESRAKSPKKSKSPARTSPRPKSPGRPRGRPKSPSRVKEAVEKEPKSTDLPKSPRKSSSRVPTPTRRSPISRRSPSRGRIPVAKKPPVVVDNETDSDTADDFDKVEVKTVTFPREKPRATVRGRTRLDLIEKVEDKKEPSVESSISSQISKRITRSHNKEVDRIVHLKHFEVTSKKLYEFSDEDEQLTKEAAADVSKPARKPDYVGILGVTIFIVSIVALGPWLFAFCNDKSCSFLKLAQKPSLLAYFNLKAFLSYFGFLLYVALLTALPFGGRRITGLPDKHGKLEYTINGLFTALITLTAVTMFQYKQINVLNFVITHQAGIYSAAVVAGLALSVFAYVRSQYVPVSALNSQTVGKNWLYNFFMGHEVHPRLVFGLLDLKIFVYRVLLLSELLVIMGWMSQTIVVDKINLQLPKDLNEAKELLSICKDVPITFLVVSCLFCLRIFDALVFERVKITSKEIQQEGFGYRMSMSYLVYPFLSSFILKYVLEHQVALAPWKLALISVIFVSGLLLARLSDNQKDAFRKNPYSPAFAHLETIPTVNGKKLLSSGLWGIVRHPNYLGTIVTELALVPFVLCAPPVSILYLNVAYLIYRARKDNEHCKQKYGIPWERYCNKVPHLVVAKVY